MVEDQSAPDRIGSVKGGPIRTCLGCRGRDEQERLLRISRSEESWGVTQPRRGAISGRGSYVHPADECITGFLNEKKLGRAFRGGVQKADLQVIHDLLRAAISETDAKAGWQSDRDSGLVETT